MRRLGRLISAVALISLLSASFGVAAWAGTVTAEGNTTVTNEAVSAYAQASSTGAPTAAPGDPSLVGASPAPDPCPYVPAGPVVSAAIGPGGPGPGTWYLPGCETFNVNGNAPIWVPAGATPNALGPVSVPGLISEAQGSATLVDPHAELNPPGHQLVNFSTWLSIPSSDWHAVVASASAGGVTATVMARPTAVVWNMGDGDTVTCGGPGTTYDPSEPASAQSTDCSYTWPRSSASEPGGVFEVTATIVYQVSSTVTGAPDPNPALGTHRGPAMRTEVSVAEVEALGSNSG